MIPDYFKKDEEISSRFKRARFVLEWRYRNLKVIMFRTFLLKKIFLSPKLLDKYNEDEYESKAAEMCLKECSYTIASMATFWKENTKNNRM